jgi:4-amino-4-deoxy-L-arabinose transferase-like glycosyltransferase
VARADRDGPPPVTLEHVDTSAPPRRAAVPRLATLAIAALFAFIILVQGISAPFQKDAEPQSAEWIQSIVRDSHWLIPHDAYGYTDRKPPLFYWLSAIVAKSTGRTVDEVRSRAVSVVAGTALATAILAWTLLNVGASEGWLAFLLILGTYGFASRATEALTDMLLTLLLFAAYSAIYPLLDSPTPISSRRKIFIGVMLGLGILTKGPVAIVLCALAISIFLLIERRNPLALLRNRWPWQVLTIAIAIGAVWYIPAAIIGGHKIVRIIFAENFGHFMPTKLGGTGESYRPFYYIAARLLGGAFPMTLLLLPAALAFYAGEISSEKRRAVIYQISMSLAVLLFFSIASVKRDDYILPALPGIAILCGSVFTLGIRSAASKLRDVIVALFVAVPTLGFLFLNFLSFFPDYVPQIKLQSSDAVYYSIFLNPPLIMSQCLFFLFPIGIAAVGLTIFGLVQRRSTVSGFGFCVIALLLSVFWTSKMRPLVAENRSLKSFVPVVLDRVKADQLCIPAGINYELSYYYGAAVPDISNPRCNYLIATPRELDAMTPDYRARLKPIAKSDLTGGGGPPALFEISPEAAK